ncbi:MAG TPA: ABC transporter permease [Candidatus Binataceae bacterium]|nr:ABC transporter permease [Candidatus Binataceae bacterium]
MSAPATTMPELQSAAGATIVRGGLAREWRLASRTVRLSAMCLVLFYLFAAASPFFAPYDPGDQNRRMPDCPPMRIHLSAPSDWSEGFFWTNPMHMVDPQERTYAPDTSRRTYIHLFSGGHLFTTDSAKEPYYLFGSDGLGRDLYSRIVYGARVSMCIGLIGVLISFSLGIVVGSLSGYVGGLTDNLIMRWSEIEMSLPSFYFLLALAAVIPPAISSATRFFLIVAIMSFISWAGLARVIRGMASSVRSLPYVEAARALGGSRWLIITRHIMPSVMGYAIVAATLSIPGYILGESALSLLGLGIQEPTPSWGNLLSAAQDPQNLAHYPWILIPGVFIFLTVMSFNFLGDHLRDRIDPSNAR